MTLQLLVATIKQKDFKLVDEMKIQSDAILLNQHDTLDRRMLCKDGFSVELLTTDTRGKSVNQNLGILTSAADILLFADDDMILENGYAEIVVKFFETYPDADGVKFYCESTNPVRPIAFKQPKKTERAGKRRLMSAGTPMFAVRRKFLIDNGTFFNPAFGPGADCPNGEDSIFFSDLFHAKARLYVSPELLAKVKQEGSTWFSAPDETYYRNIGKVYRRVYGAAAPLCILRRAIRICKEKQTPLSLSQLILCMMKK